jgi:hypothetical protein
MNLLHCKVSCYDTQLDNLGVESTLWIDFCIRVDSIVAVKRVPDNEYGEGCVIFCAGGDSFVIDTPYKKVVIMITDL